VVKPTVTDRKSIDIGVMPEESLMLTGDENIADVKFRVIWQIDPAKPEDYAFNLRNPQDTVRAVAESAMRELVGRSNFQKIITAERKNIEPAAQELLQNVLNSYHAGVLVLQVQLLQVDPPPQVIAAFKDVTASQQDQQRLSNEAEAYANKVVPEARGRAARIVQEAEGYRQQTVAEATGQVSRFNQIYDQYVKAPDVTRERLYLETMERVLGGADKIILDKNVGNAVPYLPLNDLKASGVGK
jgi:membrane protease subunit HflK